MNIGEIEVTTVHEFYAMVLNPVATEALVFRSTPATWDGKALRLSVCPELELLPGQFNLSEITIDGLRVNEWLEKQLATAPHAA
jgi:hypothetical protein